MDYPRFLASFYDSYPFNTLVQEASVHSRCFLVHQPHVQATATAGVLAFKDIVLLFMLSRYMRDHTGCDGGEWFGARGGML